MEQGNDPPFPGYAPRMRSSMEPDEPYDFGGLDMSAFDEATQFQETNQPMFNPAAPSPWGFGGFNSGPPLFANPYNEQQQVDWPSTPMVPPSLVTATPSPFPIEAPVTPTAQLANVRPPQPSNKKKAPQQPRQLRSNKSKVSGAISKPGKDSPKRGRPKVLREGQELVIYNKERKEKNRGAAARCRERRKQALLELSQLEERLKADNSFLSLELQALKDEKERVLSMLEAHQFRPQDCAIKPRTALEIQYGIGAPGSGQQTFPPDSYNPAGQNPFNGDPRFGYGP